jgi:hypothetical protein
MNLSAFFSSPTVSLPMVGFEASRKTFDVYLSDAFHAYLADVRHLDDPEFPNICAEVSRSAPALDLRSEKIVAAVKHYLEGYPYPAYKEIEKSLESISIERLFSRLSRSAHSGGFPSEAELFLECTLHPPLYRIRADRALAAAQRPSRRDIFHVPFESRHRVANERYSIAGLPCLYLGSSIWICWEELNRPEFDSVWVSRFRFFADITVLDFQFPPVLAWHLFGVVLKKFRDAQGKAPPKELQNRFDEKFIASYILCWPLPAACSVKVESRVGSFFPQYIVPQILLQWVTKVQRVDGIRYFSTKTAPKEADAYAHCSYVFPARNISGSGHCSRLREQFHLTAPISWEFLQIVDINQSNFGPSNAYATVKLSDDLQAYYRSTGFFAAEEKLGVIETYEGHSGPVEES